MEKRLLKKPYILLETSTSENKINTHTERIEFLNKKASKMNLCAENRKRYKLLSNFMPYMHTRTHAHTDSKKRDSWQKYRTKKNCLKSTLAACLLRCFFWFFFLVFDSSEQNVWSSNVHVNPFINYLFHEISQHMCTCNSNRTLLHFRLFFSSFELCSSFFRQIMIPV